MDDNLLKFLPMFFVRKTLIRDLRIMSKRLNINAKKPECPEDIRLALLDAKEACDSCIKSIECYEERE